MNVFIAYDSFALACQANALLQRIATTVGHPFRWQIKPWRTQMLRFNPAAQLAREEARDADLMFLAWDEQRPHLTWINAWLEQWAGERTVRAAALSVLEGGGACPPGEGRRQLSDFCGRYGLAFISQRERSHQLTTPDAGWIRQFASGFRAGEGPRAPAR